MKKYLEGTFAAVIVIGLLTLGGFSRLRNEPAPAPKTAIASVEKLQGETWLVRTPRGSGSAIHFRATNALPQLLTAAHVVDAIDTNATVTVSQLRRGPEGLASVFQVKVRVVWVNTDKDVALLEAATTFGFGPGIPLAQRTALVGERISHVGFFLGSDLGQSYTEGIVSALDALPRLPMWPWKNALDQMSLSGLPGSSGGPVFNAKGECVGILVGGYNPVITFFVPVRQILPLLSPPAVVRKTG